MLRQYGYPDHPFLVHVHNYVTLVLQYAAGKNHSVKFLRVRLNFMTIRIVHSQAIHDSMEDRLAILILDFHWSNKISDSCARSKYIVAMKHVRYVVCEAFRDGFKHEVKISIRSTKLLF